MTYWIHFLFLLLNVWNVSAGGISKEKLFKLMGDKCGQPLSMDELRAIPSINVIPYSAAAESIDCNTDGVTFINDASSRYEFANKPAVMAFYLSYLKDESANLRFSRNHFPGRAGQGGKTMAMPNILCQFWKDAKNKDLLDSVSKDYPALTVLPDCNDFNNPPIATADKKNFNGATYDVVLAPLLDPRNKKLQFLPGAWLISGGTRFVNPNNPTCQDPREALNSGKWEQVAPVIKECFGISDPETRINSWDLALNLTSVSYLLRNVRTFKFGRTPRKRIVL